MVPDDGSNTNWWNRVDSAMRALASALLEFYDEFIVYPLVIFIITSPMWLCFIVSYAILIWLERQQ